jgi:hypothetical protein
VRLLQYPVVVAAHRLATNLLELPVVEAEPINPEVNLPAPPQVAAVERYRPEERQRQAALKAVPLSPAALVVH